MNTSHSRLRFGNETISTQAHVNSISGLVVDLYGVHSLKLNNSLLRLMKGWKKASQWRAYILVSYSWWWPVMRNAKNSFGIQCLLDLLWVWNLQFLCKEARRSLYLYARADCAARKNASAHVSRRGARNYFLVEITVFLSICIFKGLHLGKSNVRMRVLHHVLQTILVIGLW